jgi:hypothetical protein
MQDDTTTNLKLVGPESTASISWNLQNSSKLACPLNNTTGTNEVALWALQLYIVHLAKTSRLNSGSSWRPFFDPSSATGLAPRHLPHDSPQATFHP